MKRIISTLLCVVMIGSMMITALAADLEGNSVQINIKSDDGFVLGDANGDGAVDMTDSFDLKKNCAGIATVDANSADINADGIINAKDLLLLKKCNAGLDSLASYEDENYVDSFTIAGNDISEYSIVYHEDAVYVKNSYYSATTLSRYIEKATGVSIPVVTPDNLATEHKIEMVDVTKIEGLEEKLEIENYQYEVVNGDLLIYGTRRGNMYAVYEILEDILGYRFFNTNETYLYNSRAVDIPEGTSVYHDPGLNFRFSGQNLTNDKLGYYFPRRLNGSTLYSHDGETHGTLTGPHFINAHSYGYYYKMATGIVDITFDGTNNYDYRLKLDAGIEQNELEWNPCSTDDLMYATLFRGLLEMMRYIQGWHTFRPETSSMSFSICDNPYYMCSCKNCRFISATGTSPEGERLGAGGSGLNIYLANRACRDIREYYEGRAASMEECGDGEYSEYGYGEAITDAYPDMKLYTIFYDPTPPNENLFTDERYADLIPEENLIIMFCGQACNNHYMGTGECGDKKNNVGLSGEVSAKGFKGWGEACKQTGAEIWFWYYSVSYNTFLSDSPNITNIYYDFKYAVEECNCTGLFYEGGSGGYIFENLKAYLATKFMWSVEKDEEGNLSFMSYEEFEAVMMEYLNMYYGDGAEYLYEYIMMQDEAANETGKCYVNNLDYPGDMFDYEYMRDNYEYMRDLAAKALALAETEAQIRRCEQILMNAEFLGLSACHKSWYVEGNDAEKKAVYEERYTWLYNYVKNNNINLWVYDINNIPLDMSKSPMVLFYTGGSWSIDNQDTWGYLGSNPSWGYGG